MIFPLQSSFKNKGGSRGDGCIFLFYICGSHVDYEQFSCHALVASLIFPSMHTLFPFLDRSWARRARGGGAGTKKRPELLNADFYGDRERPGSPSPGSLVEKTTSEEDIKPKYV